MRRILCAAISALLLCRSMAAYAAGKTKTEQPAEPAVYLTERSPEDPDGGWKAGDTLLFGTYEQDGDEENGPEPIEWIVLENDGGEMFLLSRYVLDSVFYGDYRFKQRRFFWKSSHAREWMNDTFLQRAFSQEEQDRILWSLVRNPDEGSGWEKYGGDTMDKVFLMSLEEGEKYLPTKESRSALPTHVQAEKIVTDSHGTARWMLRDPGRQKIGGEIVFVYGNGKIDRSGSTIETGIRPAIRVTWKPEQVPEEERAPYYQKGDSVWFGSYDQDNIPDNGPEPIEWFVLNEHKGKVLLLSRYGLESRCMDSADQYYSDYMFDWGITWETTTMREWLNGPFYSSAFSAEEAAGISPMAVGAGILYPSAEGSDRVFLLSVGEVERYLTTDGLKGCIYTAHAVKTGDIGNNDLYSTWWLRSTREALGMDTVGSTLDIITETDNTYWYAVRPALWVDAEHLRATELADPETAAGEDELKADPAGSRYHAGDTLIMGRYEQDNDEENGPEPVEWTVLDIQDGKALVISRYVLDCMPFHSEYAEETTWETSTLRTWMNSGFAKSVFTEEELARIRISLVNAEWNPHFNDHLHNPGNATEDRLFLLDIAEAERYLKTRNDRICMPTVHAAVRGMLARYCDWSGEQEENMKVSYGDTEAGKVVHLSIPYWDQTVTCNITFNGDGSGFVVHTNADEQTTVRTAEGWRWWLRSPGLMADQIAYVFIDGTVIPSGEGSDYAVIGIRPAMWIDID